MVSVYSCGTVDGAYGPVKNPWQYKFHQQADERALHSASGVQSTSHIQRVSQHARDYHISSHTSDHAHPVYSSDQTAVDTDTEVSDWFITGGSSGGSAVAVATGVAFA